MCRSVCVVITMLALFIGAMCVQNAPSALARTAATPPTVASDEQLTFEIYKDSQGEYRWRLKSPNKQTIGSSGQGYKAKSDCEHAITVIKDNAAKAKIEEIKDE